MVSETYYVDVCDGGDDKYRFGFNGMEKDNEVKGIGNSLDFGARMYDSRVGRWLSLDTYKKPHLSGYQFGALNPITFIDPDGNTEYYFNGKWIGSDGEKNGLISIVKTKEVKEKIEKGEYSYPESKTLSNGFSNNDMFVIDANVLKTSYEVLQKGMSKKGRDREFGATMLLHEDGRYRIHSQGIVEGRKIEPEELNPKNKKPGGDIELPPGPKSKITIHSHPTMTFIDKAKEEIYFASSDKPSPADMDNMDDEAMMIIVGKKGDANLKKFFTDQSGSPIREPRYEPEDYRDSSIEIYNKDNKTKSLQSIGGKEAEKILKDYEKR